MESENKRLKVLIVILLVFLIAFGGYYFYEKVVLVNNKENPNEYINDIITSKDSEIVFKITSFDSARIIGDEPGEGNNHMISVIGKMELSYDEKNYDIVRIEGYCLDENNNKHTVWSAINNGEEQFTLYGYVQGEELLKQNINWNNVKITYCKIDKLLALDLNNNKKELVKEINFEHNF